MSELIGTVSYGKNVRQKRVRLNCIFQKGRLTLTGAREYDNAHKSGFREGSVTEIILEVEDVQLIEILEIVSLEIRRRFIEE